MINLYNEAGNVAVRMKGIWKHEVLIMPNGWIYENLPGRGEGLSTIAEFMTLSQGSFTVKRYSMEQRQLHVQRALVELQTPRGWSPFHNCQDTIARVVEGAPRSHQRDLVGLGIASLALLAIASR